MAAGLVSTSRRGDRELLDFHFHAIDNQGEANLILTRSIDGVDDIEPRFAKQP
jgi:hypothetical protein